MKIQNFVYSSEIKEWEQHQTCTVFIITSLWQEKDKLAGQFHKMPIEISEWPVWWTESWFQIGQPLRSVS